MRRTAEVHYLPLRRAARGKAFRETVGAVALLFGHAALIATVVTYSLPMLVACLGCYVIGGGCLYGSDWVLGRMTEGE